MDRVGPDHLAHPQSDKHLGSLLTESLITGEYV